MVAIPFLKLFSLTVKTLAKPMAKRIKSEAQKRDAIRGILNKMGQTVNSVSVRVNIGMAGHKTTKIKPLEEDKAVAAGGELLAEGFVYGVAGTLVVWEYMASANEKDAKDHVAKAKKAKEEKDLKDALEAINRRLESLEAFQAMHQDHRSGLEGQTTAEQGNPAPWWKTLGFLGAGKNRTATDSSSSNSDSTAPRVHGGDASGGGQAGCLESSGREQSRGNSSGAIGDEGGGGKQAGMPLNERYSSSIGSKENAGTLESSDPRAKGPYKGR